MAFGMDGESRSDQEQRDEVFLIRVEEWVGRALTDEEEEIAFGVRDQHGYSAQEAATEVLAHSVT